MSVVAIPFGETLSPYASVESFRRGKMLATSRFYDYRSPLRNDLFHETSARRWTKNRNDTSATKFLSLTNCDPLLDFINFADFENDEANRSFYDRLIPINITKCDLQTKLFKNDRKPTAKRLCKQFPLSKPVKPITNVKEKDDSFGGRILQPVSIAEFVDINEELQKYRRRFLLELKQGIDSDASVTYLATEGHARNDCDGTSLDTEGYAGSLVNDIGSDSDPMSSTEVIAEGKSPRENEEMDLKCCKYGVHEEKKAAVEELKLKFNARHVKARAHKKSCYSNRNEKGNLVRPSTSQEKPFRKGLIITSENKAPMLTSLLVSETKLRNKRRKITKLNRLPPAAHQPSTKPEIPLGVAYENKLTELREKTFKLLAQDSLKEIFGDKFEKLQPNWVNSVWFQALVDEIGKKAENLRNFKRELTRAFCFSYFELFRKHERVD